MVFKYKLYGFQRKWKILKNRDKSCPGRDPGHLMQNRDCPGQNCADGHPTSKTCYSSTFGKNCVNITFCLLKFNVIDLLTIQYNILFQILTKEDQLKVIPKKHTNISFVVQNQLVTLSCTNFCMKPSERAVKKWKNKAPYEF